MPDKYSGKAPLGLWCEHRGSKNGVAALIFIYQESTIAWKNFEQSNPALAAFGVERLNGKVAYLATIRKDGSPRVHPMTPIIAEGRLFVFMEPISPKAHDLRRDACYAIHCSVSDTSGESGEFILSGQAYLVEDSRLRDLAKRYSPYAPADRYILFEFEVGRASATAYENDHPVRTHWKCDE